MERCTGGGGILALDCENEGANNSTVEQIHSGNIQHFIPSD